jgi:hypothetical protein
MQGQNENTLYRHTNSFRVGGGKTVKEQMIKIFDIKYLNKNVRSMLEHWRTILKNTFNPQIWKSVMGYEIYLQR